MLCRLNREFNGEETADAEQIRRSILSCNIEHCFVCKIDGNLVGFICGICYASLCYKNPVAQLTELYVLPAFRRRGVGTALIQAMVSHMRSLGAREFMLLTGCDNIAAQHLYERCGFHKEDECCYQMFCE